MNMYLIGFAWPTGTRVVNRRQRVYGRRGEWYSRACIKIRDIIGERSVMVWAGIYHAAKTHLVVIQDNLSAL